jgi:putative DNA methylase
MAVVAEGNRGRVYLDPVKAHADTAISSEEFPTVQLARSTFLSGSVPTRAMITGGVCSAYGLATWANLFSSRQLLALTTLSDLVGEARQQVHHDALHADEEHAVADGIDAKGYADAVSVYLALAVDRQANRTSTLCFWDSKGENVQQVFGRQALAMTWDYTESNPLGTSTGNYVGQVVGLSKVIDNCLSGYSKGYVSQQDAQKQDISRMKFVSTDPPYYDNISYADLSDFFYVWLRRSLRDVYPDLFEYDHRSKGG